MDMEKPERWKLEWNWRNSYKHIENSKECGSIK